MPDAPAPTAVTGYCPRCAAPVVWGQTAQGALVAVEPQVPTYVLVWDRGARWPRLAQSRGYVAHGCGDES
jgi:hypothetical protein